MADHWTVRMRDGSLSAHFEETIAILDEGPEVLTRIRERSGIREQVGGQR
jgi:methionyl aminopeptidase